MIDAAVMADVKQQRLRRDGGFDLCKVLSERVHYSRAGRRRRQRQTTKSKDAALLAVSLSLAVSLRVGREPALARPTRGEACAPHTLSRQAHRFGAYKGVALRERREGARVLKLRFFPPACESHSEHGGVAPSSAGSREGRLFPSHSVKHIALITQ